MTENPRDSLLRRARHRTWVIIAGAVAGTGLMTFGIASTAQHVNAATTPTPTSSSTSSSPSSSTDDSNSSSDDSSDSGVSPSTSQGSSDGGTHSS